MTDNLDLSALEELLDGEHLDHLVAGAMERIRGRRSVAVGLGRLWPSAVAVAAAAVALALFARPAPARPPNVVFDPIVTFGAGLDIPRTLVHRAATGESISVEEALVLMAPEGR